MPRTLPPRSWIGRTAASRTSTTRLEGLDRDWLGAVQLRRLGGGEPGRLVALQYTEVLRHALDEGGINRGLARVGPTSAGAGYWHYVCLAGWSRVGVSTMP